MRLRDLLLGLRELHLGNAPVIVHSSLKSFGEVEGGAEIKLTEMSDAELLDLVRLDIHSIGE